MLTAGLATRLQPLSSVRAKAALPVAGTPLVTRILRWLRAAGIRRVVLNLHHRADTITRIVGDGSALGLAVRYSWETEILGSAGGPARAFPLLEADRFLIVNGDTLADVDLRGAGARSTSTPTRWSRWRSSTAAPRYNGVIADAGAGIVRGFGPRTRRAFHFIGVQAVNASVFAGVGPDTQVGNGARHLPAPDRAAGRARCACSTPPPSSSTSARRATTSTPRHHRGTRRPAARSRPRLRRRGRRIAHQHRCSGTASTSAPARG